MTQFVMSFFLLYLPRPSQIDDAGKHIKLLVSQSNNLPFVKIQSYNKRPARSITAIVLSIKLLISRDGGIVSERWETIFFLSFLVSLSYVSLIKLLYVIF